ncbi:hypothetical protein D3C80_1737350 [compost metagenome]
MASISKAVNAEIQVEASSRGRKSRVIIGERRCGDRTAVNRLTPNISITAVKCTKRHSTNRVARVMA